MQKLSVNHLDTIFGIVRRGELTPELARRGRDISPERAQYLLDTARHEAAHVVAAWACPEGCVIRVGVSPYARPRSRWPLPAYARVCAALYEHEAFISLAGPVEELIMARQRGTPLDERCRFASSTDIKSAKQECKHAGIAPRDVGLSVLRFLNDTRMAVDCMAVAILLLSNQSGQLNLSKLVRIRTWLAEYIPLYANYKPGKTI